MSPENAFHGHYVVPYRLNKKWKTKANATASEYVFCVIILKKYFGGVLTPKPPL